jgi:predicted kinase
MIDKLDVEYSRRKRGPMLYMLGGLPGAGKTSFSRYASKEMDAVHLNSVAMRHTLNLDSDEMPRAIGDPYVFEAMNSMAKTALAAGCDVFYDANHNTQPVRARSRTLAHDVGASALLVWIEVPRDIAEYRASTRQPDNFTKRVVSETIRNYILEPPLADETHILLNGLEATEDQYINFIRQENHE